MNQNSILHIGRAVAEWQMIAHLLHELALSLPPEQAKRVRRIASDLESQLPNQDK